MHGVSFKAQRDTARRLEVRVLMVVPQGGFCRQLGDMQAWLDEVCGEGCWAVSPAGLASVVNDAGAFYFGDAALAQAFVNRFCCGYRPV